MLQGKVIRERPLPGLAHAFVFWGFCAFALITLNHLATGFGLRLAARARRCSALVYFYFVAIFAVAVAVSIAGTVRPPLHGAAEVAGRGSPESGVIALLIFVLMVTYLAGMPGCGFEESHTAGRRTGGRTRWRCCRFCR